MNFLYKSANGCRASPSVPSRGRGAWSSAIRIRAPVSAHRTAAGWMSDKPSSMAQKVGQYSLKEMQPAGR